MTADLRQAALDQVWKTESRDGLSDIDQYSTVLSKVAGARASDAQIETFAIARRLAMQGAPDEAADLRKHLNWLYDDYLAQRDDPVHGAYLAELAQRDALRPVVAALEQALAAMRPVQDRSCDAGRVLGEYYGWIGDVFADSEIYGHPFETRDERILTFDERSLRNTPKLFARIRSLAPVPDDLNAALTRIEAAIAAVPAAQPASA